MTSFQPCQDLAFGSAARESWSGPGFLRPPLRHRLTVGGSLAAIAVAGLLLARLPAQMREAYRRVEHTEHVFTVSEAIRGGVASAASEARGFVLDRSVASLNRFQAAVAKIEDDSRHLAALTSDDPQQSRAVGALENLIDTGVDSIRRIIAPLQRNREAEAWDAVGTQQGRMFGDQIGDAIATIESTEETLLSSRRQEADRFVTLSIVGLLIGCGGGVFALAWLLGLRTGEQSRRVLLQARQAQARARELERKIGQRTAELKASETRLRNYFDAVSHVLITIAVGTDGSFVFEAVNPAAEALFGMREEQMRGRRPIEVFPHESGELVEQRYRECVVARRPISYIRVDTRSGQPRHLRVTLTPVIAPPEIGHPDGRVRLLHGLTVDETEKLDLQDSLRQAQKLEAIGQLSAGVAHDFNNILQTVSGGLEFILEDLPPDGELHELGTIALRSARRGAQLTHQLLSYARKQTLRPQHVDTATFLAEIRLLLSRTLGSFVAIKLRVAPDVGGIFVDVANLQTALINLALNASQAMPNGGTLTFEAANAPMFSDQPQHVLLAIADTGAGMDEATLARAREPFFTTKGVRGTGLGLSMVEGFVRQSGGELSVTSEPGRGTRVEMALPRHAGPPEPPELAAGRLGLPRPLRILLVDDAPDVLLATHAGLKGAGFAVLCAGSASAALQLLHGPCHVDAIVTDYAMPDQSGPEMIERARRRFPGLPAVIITGCAELRGADFGFAVRVLRKPFSQAELTGALLDLLEFDPSSCRSDHVLQVTEATASADV